MSMLNNPYLFTQIGLDSGALTQLGIVAHKAPDPGLYQGTVFLKDQVTGNFALRVDENSVASQVNIDLASVGPNKGSCCNPAVPSYVVHPAGYVLFHVGSGPGGFAATISKINQAPLFDTRALQAGDLFSATLLRPGTYAAHSTGAQDSRIVVGYPSGGGRVAYQPPTPARVILGSGRFNASAIELKPAQPVVFEIQQQARIVIELVTPDDGPNAGKRLRTREKAG